MIQDHILWTYQHDALDAEKMRLPISRRMRPTLNPPNIRMYCILNYN